MTKTKIRQKRAMLFVITVALLALCAGSMLLISPMKKADAWQKPGEFGGTVGGSISCVYETQPAQAQNYRGRYVIWKNGTVDGDEGNILYTAANKSVVSDGSNGLTESNFTVAEVEASDAGGTHVFFRGGTSGDIDIGNWAGFGSRAAYETKFGAVPGAVNPDHGFKLRAKAAYLDLYENGLRDGNNYAEGDFNIGISIGAIDTWGGTAPKVEYWYGTSSSFNDGGKISNMKLVYNNETDSFFALHSEPARLWSIGEDRNTYGLPYSNLELASELRSDGITLPVEVLGTDVIQIFKNRIIKADGAMVTGEYDFATTTFGQPTSDKVTISGVYNRMGALEDTYVVKDGAVGYQHHFYNYEKGSAYVYVKTEDKAQSGLQFFGGAKFNMGTVDATKTSALTRAQARALTTMTDVSSTEIGVEHDSGANTNVNNLLNTVGSSRTITDLYPVFKAKYAEMKTANINPGLRVTGVKEWDKIIMQEMTLGDSTVSRDNRPGYSWLVYDDINNKVHYIKDEFLAYICGNRDRHEQSGFFLTDSHYQVEMSGGGEKTVLLAEKGYYELNGSTVTWNAGKKYDETTKTFIDIPTFRTSDYGALVGTSYEYGGYTYQNLRNAYVKYRYVNHAYEYTYKANHNFSQEGGAPTFAAVAQSIYLENFDSAVSIVENSASGEYVGDAIKNLTTAQKNQIKANFKQAVIDAVESGWAMGIRANNSIKGWDGVIVLEYKFGDGEMYHDGSPTSSRSKMSLLVLNTETYEAFLVSTHALLYGQSAKATLSYPVSGTFASIDITLGEKTVTLTNVQFFKAGYIYTVNNVTKTVTGYKYVPADGPTLAKLIPVPAPTVPENFGTESNRYEVDGDFYINYVKGAVYAKANAAGTGYYYVTYFGRFFDSTEEYALKKLPLESIVAVSDFKYGQGGSKPASFTGTDAEFLKLFYDAYKYWYDQGIILGKIDEGIKGWSSNTHIVQFIFGDSTGDPFADSRDGVAALSYNATTGEVYLIFNGGINEFAFEDNHKTLKTPIENPVYHAELGIWTQRFEGTSYVGGVMVNNFIVWNGVTGSILQNTDYDKFISEYVLRAAEHDKDNDKGYIGIGDVDYDSLNLPEKVIEVLADAAAALTGTLSVIGAAGILFADKKKKIGSSLFRRIK